jgi:carboxylesterase type B
MIRPDPQEKGLPVMVYVHGGGFVAGDGSDDLAGPNYLLDRDVILVTMNYRLGPLGFFSLDDASISGKPAISQAVIFVHTCARLYFAGNQGMWDQREALHWVQSNIRAFGGNPKSVTLFGESAGSMCVISTIFLP